jgi:hypothetical protein
MDATPQYTEAEIQINHLIAERESLKAQLEEYLYIISVRDKEIENLRRKMAEKIEFQSDSNNRDQELQSLQDNIYQLKLRNEAAIEQIGLTTNTEHQLEDSEQQQTYFQTQLTGLQEQIQELNNRNLFLQQEASRAAELESLLEDAERERDELKEQLAKQEGN